MPEIINKSEFEELKKRILKKYKDDADILKMIEQVKTGIVWEENSEKINGNVFQEVIKKRIGGNREKENLIIEGENLETLDFLMKDYKRKINLIYIDPPYNTGNSNLGYNDSRKSRTDGYSHSAWLSFIKKRLVKARELMAETSAIFISIDEYQQAHLKLLCDEIFGENNCLATFIRKTKTITGDNSSGLNVQHEFLIAYAKNRKKIVLRGERKKFEKYLNPDNDPNGKWIAGDPSAKSGGSGTYFEIVNPVTGQTDLPPKGRYWAFSKETMKEYVKNGRIKFRTEIKKNQRGFIFKRYASSMKNQYMPFGTLDFAANEFLNSVATKELSELVPENSFLYPKPVAFIKKIIKSFPDDDITVLDFFAGSGTTGQAVLELNEEDDGNRNFILCNSNENGICEKVAFERIKKIYGKIKNKGSLKYLKEKFE